MSQPYIYTARNEQQSRAIQKRPRVDRKRSGRASRDLRVAQCRLYTPIYTYIYTHSVRVDPPRERSENDR